MKNRKKLLSYSTEQWIKDELIRISAEETLRQKKKISISNIIDVALIKYYKLEKNIEQK